MKRSLELKLQKKRILQRKRKVSIDHFQKSKRKQKLKTKNLTKGIWSDISKKMTTDGVLSNDKLEDILKNYDWPGNVRELENKLKRAVVMADQPFLEPADLGFVNTLATEHSAEATSGGMVLDYMGLTLKEARQRLEKKLVLVAMENEEGNIVRSAEVLGVSRPTLYDLLKKHGLQGG